MQHNLKINIEYLATQVTRLKYVDTINKNNKILDSVIGGDILMDRIVYSEIKIPSQCKMFNGLSYSSIKMV